MTDAQSMVRGCTCHTSMFVSDEYVGFRATQKIKLMPQTKPTKWLFMKGCIHI